MDQTGEQQALEDDSGAKTSDVSATRPDVTIRGNCVAVGEWHDRVYVEAYDLDAFIEALVAARNKLRDEGYLTAWSRDADGMGNCGAVPSARR